MTCQIKEEQILLYLFNEGTKKELSFMASHMTSCTDCQEKASLLRECEQAWNFPDPSFPSDSFIDQVMEHLPEMDLVAKQHKKDKKRWKHWSIVHFAAASAATIFLLYAGVFNQLPDLFQQFTTVFQTTTINLEQVSGNSLGWLDTVQFQFTQLISQFKL